jgi:hypothetical protein
MSRTACEGARPGVVRTCCSNLPSRDREGAVWRTLFSAARQIGLTYSVPGRLTCVGAGKFPLPWLR